MRTLVTGATGFLGRHLVDGLCAAGHEVVAMARSTPRDAAPDGVTRVRGDVLDAAAMADAVRGCEAVFHCAGAVSRDPADAEMLWRSHVVGTRTVLAASRAAGVKRVVYASTSGTVAIAEDDRPRREDDPASSELIQRFGYYRAKAYAEREALAASDGAMAVVAINPSLLLGPGDVNGSSTGDVKNFLSGRIPAAPAGGLSFVDARDAAAGMVLALTRGVGGRRYLLGAANWTVRLFFDRLSRVSGVKAPMMTMPKGRRVARLGAGLMDGFARLTGADNPVDAVSAEMGQLYWYVDSTRAETELGWSARDPMVTLADTVNGMPRW